MSREEIIEKAVINLIVENTALKMDCHKAKEEKDYWFEAYQNAKKDHENLLETINIKNKENRLLEDKVDNCNTRIKDLKSIINKNNEQEIPDLSESADNIFDPADNQ